MAVVTASAIGSIQKCCSLLFTGSGSLGDEMNIPIPGHQFEGQLIGSAWYHIQNPNPETGDLAIALIEGGVNKLEVGINYAIGDEGIFYAALNDTFRFESPALFDADNYNEWMHFAYFLDWQTPTNSLLFWNNISQGFDILSAANSTEFAPTQSISSIDAVVQDVEFAQIYLAPSSPDTTPPTFVADVLPRFSNGKSPLSLGRRGGLAQGNRDSAKTLPWIYTSFADKIKDGNPLVPRNDFQDGEITFGAFTDFELKQNANITLPPGALTKARWRARQNKRKQEGRKQHAI